MSTTERIFVASTSEAGLTHGSLSPFAPGTRTLAAGWRAAPQFKALPIDIVFDKDVAVTLRDGVTIYVDVFRPPGPKRYR